jgi:putative membrane protein
VVVVDSQYSDLQLVLAAERTLLSWIRTGLSMMGFGFVVARFGLFLREMAFEGNRHVRPSTHMSIWLGTVLVGVGVVALLVSARDHARYLRHLGKSFDNQIPRRTLGIQVGIALSALGTAMVAYLLVLALE